MKTHLKRVGNTLKSQRTGKSYKVLSRKKITPTKPAYFLLETTGGKRKYISSLYGEFPEFSFEYQGKRYTLTLSDTEAKITLGGAYVY